METGKQLMTTAKAGAAASSGSSARASKGRTGPIGAKQTGPPGPPPGRPPGPPRRSDRRIVQSTEDCRSHCVA